MKRLRDSRHRCRFFDPVVSVAISVLLFSSPGCSYLPKNHAHAVYSLAKYGTDRFAVVDGFNIHYVEVGNGPPVMLIPGAFCTYRVWNRIVPILSKDYKILAVDYIGVGDSDKPEEFGYTIQEQADILAEMIRQLDLGKVRLVGSSYGGLISLDLAARYPELVDSVVSIEGGALIIPEVLRYKGMSDVFQWPLVGDVLWSLMKTNLFPETVSKAVIGDAWDEFDAAEREEIQEMLSANIGTASRTSWFGIDRTISGTIDITDDVLKMKVPLLYVYGGLSKYREMSELNAWIFKDNLPSAQVVRIEGGIHDVHMQYPARLAWLFTGFSGETRNDRKLIWLNPLESPGEEAAGARYAEGEVQ
jgi:pimeloyl-ACP methyl ester carboxylesterase